MAGPTPSDNVFVSDLPGDIDEDTLKALFEQYAEVTQCRVLQNNLPGTRRSALVRFGSVEHATAIVENLNNNIPQGMTTPVRVQFARSPDGKDGKMSGKGKMMQNTKAMGKGAGGGGGGGAGAGGQWVAPDSNGGGGGMMGMMNPMMMMGMMGGMWDGGCDGGMTGGKGKGKGGAKGATIKDVLELMEKLGALPNAKQAAEGGIVYIRGLPSDTTHFEMYRMFAPFGSLASVHAMWNDDGSCKGFGFANYLEATSAQLAVQTLNGFQTGDGGTLELNIKDKGDKGGRKGGKGGDQAQAQPQMQEMDPQAQMAQFLQQHQMQGCGEAALQQHQQQMQLLQQQMVAQMGQESMGPMF
eukprot:TRINITY_DN1007_c0_g1_i1.p1 TRINITY_DN1007_c0_g1~~TRINITY_DN1007_c0_g1_i1.p1  ORF type:complete len:355 (-),score=106.38 TRINITY_DN1007_c0_g1_i1:103-1167(-)